MDVPGAPRDVTIHLTADEALVLFEFLARFADEDAVRIDDAAETAVLWKLHGQLERTLVEPFDPNYALLLQVARDRLRPAAE